MNIKNAVNLSHITILLLAFLIPLTTFSDEKSGPTAKDRAWQISLGLGAALKNNIRIDNNRSGSGGDVIVNVLPLIQLSFGPISLGQQGVNAGVYGNKLVGVSINFNQAGDRYEGSNMETRNLSWLLGFGFKYYKFSALIAKDVTNRSRGTKLSLHYTESYPLSEKTFTRSSVGLECYSQSFADYYYGVKSNEVTSVRNEYHPKQYCLPTLSFFPGYKYDDHLNIMTGFSFKALSSQIRKSPTTNGAWLESALIFGGLWKF